jgi:hypothetical protein
MDKIRSEYVAKNIWDTHEKIIEKCRDKGLQQSAYFFERDLNFRLVSVTSVISAAVIYFSPFFPGKTGKACWPKSCLR